MKKKLFLLIFAVIGIIAAITVSITQLRSADCNEILHANIEALAGQGGGEGIIRCAPEGDVCKYYIMLCDSNGNPKKDPEGNTILVEKEIYGLKNISAEAQ